MFYFFITFLIEVFYLFISFSVHSSQELHELLDHGDAAKRRAATAMNERSTRAHTVFVLSLQARTFGPAWASLGQLGPAIPAWGSSSIPLQST